MQSARQYIECLKSQSSKSLLILTRIQFSVDVIIALLMIKGMISYVSLLLFSGIPFLLWLEEHKYRLNKGELYIAIIANRLFMFYNIAFMAGIFIACLTYTTSWYHIGRYLVMTLLTGMNIMCGLFTDEDFRSLSIYMRAERDLPPISMYLHGHPSGMKTAAVA